MKPLLLILQLALLHQLTHALPPPRIPDILERINLQKLSQKQQKEEGLLELPSTTQQKKSKEDTATANNPNEDVATLYFDQRLNHFPDTNDTSGNNPSKTTTFKQRYFYSSRYVNSSSKDDSTKNTKKKSAVAFLCVGGEGPSMDTSVLINSVHCTGDMIGLAEKLYTEENYDVHLFALEHRFYGESFPTPLQTSSGNLRGSDEEGEDKEYENGEDEFVVDYTFLSSRQAIMDIVQFVKSPVALQHLMVSDGATADKVKWITFGGSYPGMLSAWSHLLHPEAIFAAVSNSAPIQAELDFSQYHEHVGNDLENEEVGGSKLCRQIVEEGHEEAAAILEQHTSFTGEEDNDSSRKKEKKVDEDSSEDGHGLERLAQLFNVCGGADSLRASRRNQEVFIGDGLINIPAQSNDPSCDPSKNTVCDIKRLCDAIVKERKLNDMKSSMEILADIDILSKKAQLTCTDVNWQSFVWYYKNPMKQNANDRSWLYQTCNEFGFYQTCNKVSNCPYGKGYHGVDRDFEICQVAFNIDSDTVKQNVESTLSYYGGTSLTPNTGEKVGPNSMIADGEDTLVGQKRIVFLTGDVDPWTELSFTAKGNKDHPSISVQGASHHFWTHQIKDSDSDFVVNARKAIYSTVTAWLEDSLHFVPTVEKVTVTKTE